MNSNSRKSGKVILILAIVSGLLWACPGKRSSAMSAGDGTANRNAVQKETAATIAEKGLVLNVDSGEAITGLKVIGFSPQSNTIVFSKFEVNKWYRRPLILKKGNASVRFCFESPFLSSYFDHSNGMDAVFWFPGIENEFGKASPRDDRLTMKVQIIQEDARERLRSIVQPIEGR
jgi:hypothetical protein